MITHRYDGVQALRFVAALMVVLTHSFYYTSERLGAGVLKFSGGAKGVDVFFVISGFVMIISSQRLFGTERGWSVFMSNRLVRIAPLYWVATTFKLVVLLAMSRYVLHSSLDWEVIIKSYLFIPSRNIDGVVAPFLGVGWTLVYEMFFYIIFACALYLNVNVFVFVGFLLAGFSSLSLFQGDSQSVWWFITNPLIMEFYFGMLIGYFAMRGYCKLSVTASCAIALVALCYLMFSPNLFDLPRLIEGGVPAALLVWCIVSVEGVIQSKVPRWVIYFGAASYSFYLFHPLVSPLAPVILRRAGVDSFVLSVLLCVAIALSFSSLVHTFLEKPMTSYIKIFLSRIKLALIQNK